MIEDSKLQKVVWFIVLSVISGAFFAEVALR